MLLWLLALAILVALIYGMAGVFLIRLVARWRRKEKNTRSVTRVMQWVFFTLAIVGVVCIVWGLWVEPYWPDVTRTTVAVEALPDGIAPIRVVQLSDTHSDSEPRLEPSIPGLVAGLEPDLIIFTGDALNEEGGLRHFRTMMTELARIAPTFAVYGNWDVWYWTELDLFADTGVHVLDGHAELITIDGQEIWIAGSAVGDDSGLSAALENVPSDRLTIFVHHYPERVVQAAEHGVDLVLSGDTHGGQLRLPLLGPIVEMTRFGVYYDMGLHEIEGTWLYVNRGVGMEGGHAPRARFMCRPEIAVIEISPAR